MPALLRPLLFSVLVPAQLYASSGHVLGAAQGMQNFRSEYAVSFLGITLAKSSFESSFDGDSFSVSGRMSSVGIANVFDTTSGTVSANGRFSGDQTRPDAFSAKYTLNGKPKSTTIAFAKGNVTKAVNLPPPRKRTDLVPASPAQLKAVSDPLSATLVKANGLGDICNRTIKIFDGEMRADIALAPKASGPVSMAGYKGETVTCAGRFVPVAGYRIGNRSIEYLKNKARITVMFAPLGQTGIYAPIRASVTTKIGTVTVQARKFQ